MEGSLFNLQQMVNDSNSESGSSYSSRTSNKSESQIVEPEKIGQDDSNESYNKEKSSFLTLYINKSDMKRIKKIK